ncbi:uncharacterized protein TRAVEDRAFT_26768, partial [Trametes versicolor FP-101664 SS1]|uniref:uncharacterized protein n=1 Tax=Trametes versicolor (strain FP-101664) TaxID=717944 RepID=UPI00046248A8
TALSVGTARTRGAGRRAQLVAASTFASEHGRRSHLRPRRRLRACPTHSGHVAWSACFAPSCTPCRMRPRLSSAGPLPSRGRLPPRRLPVRLPERDGALTRTTTHVHYSTQCRPRKYIASSSPVGWLEGGRIRRVPARCYVLQWRSSVHAHGRTSAGLSAVHRRVRAVHGGISAGGADAQRPRTV